MPKACSGRLSFVLGKLIWCEPGKFPEIAHHVLIILVAQRQGNAQRVFGGLCITDFHGVIEADNSVIQFRTNAELG